QAHVARGATYARRFRAPSLSARARQLEALSAKAEYGAVLHDLLDDDTVADALAGPIRVVVYVENAIRRVRRIDVDGHGELRKRALELRRHRAQELHVLERSRRERRRRLGR